ncbi:major facilitator superfamily domain-containing protein [Xylariales sp. AK1849]|nr:major facilitator superfamily domain-containing protein [Xylariales sp. AK1849]
MSVLESLRQFLSGTRQDASSKPPLLLSLRSSKFFIILTVCLALFTDIFYYALVVPVIPFSLTVQVGLPEGQVQQWTAVLLACYSLALFVASPFVGLYADHTSSRRWPLLIGLVALAASTLLLCLGRSIGLLVLGRLLQGFSAAIVWSVGCALLVDTMESSVGIAMGYVATAMSVGLLIAPVVGGAVYAAAGYYAVYYIAFGVVLVDILLRLGMIEKKVAKQWMPEEIATRTPSADKTAEKATELNGLRNPPDSSGAQLSADLPVFILIRSPRLIAALYAILVQAGIMMGFDAVLALFVQETFNWNSTAAGLMFLAIFAPGFVSPAVGWLADRYGAKWPSLAGFITLIPTIICLRFVTENTISHKVLLGALLAITGVALSFSNTPLMAEVGYIIDQRAKKNPGIFGEKGVYGIGYGLFTMSFALGGTVGPLWAGYVHNSAGWGTMTWSLALWAASGAVVVFIWLGSNPPKSEAGQDHPAEQEVIHL